MSEIKRVATPMANKMTVLDEGEEILRSPSSLSRRPLKKATSEGLISLSAEPGNVKFEVGNHKGLGSEGTRCNSAGRVERKLQLFKKKENTEEQRRNSADGILYNPQPDNPLVTKINDMAISTTTTTTKTKLLQDEKPSNTAKPKSEGSESESESDESESDDDETEENAVSSDEKLMAPLEVKAEFLQCVMSGNYAKAQETCKQILLLEPDNATCQEFHSVIATKIEQDNIEDSDEDDSEDDDDEEEDDDDDEDSDEDDSNTSSSSEESEEDTDDEEFTVAPGLNLLMGGLPVKPQAK